MRGQHDGSRRHYSPHFARNIGSRRFAAVPQASVACVLKYGLNVRACVPQARPCFVSLAAVTAEALTTPRERFKAAASKTGRSRARRTSTFSGFVKAVGLGGECHASPTNYHNTNSYSSTSSISTFDRIPASEGSERLAHACTRLHTLAHACTRLHTLAQNLRSSDDVNLEKLTCDAHSSTNRRSHRQER